MTSHFEATYEPLGDPVTDEPRFDDVMIDIETMSLHPNNALILSIGMIQFDPRSTLKGLGIGKRMLIIPEIAPQLALGRQVDKSTQEFWAAQKPEARDHWLNAKEHWPLMSAIIEVRDFCAGHSRIWANGTQFDLSNVLALKEDTERAGARDIGPLWHYRAPRDMRTFCEETSLHPDRDEHVDVVATYGIIEHEPVSDCIAQAFRVWQHAATGDSN